MANQMTDQKFRFSIALNKLDQARVFKKSNGDLMLDFIAFPKASPYGDTHWWQNDWGKT